MSSTHSYTAQKDLLNLKSLMELQSTAKILEQLQLRPSLAQRSYQEEVSSFVGLEDPSFQLKNAKEIKFENDERPIIRSNLDKLDKKRQVKTVTYQRIKEITHKMDDRNIHNPRFDLNYQSNILEIDNRLQEPACQNKLQFIRDKFRQDINQISNNLLREVEIQAKEPVMKQQVKYVQQKFDLITDKAMYNIENNLDQLNGIANLKKVNLVMQENRNTGFIRQQLEQIEYEKREVNKAYLKRFEKRDHFGVCNKQLANYEDTMHHPDCIGTKFTSKWVDLTVQETKQIYQDSTKVKKAFASKSFTVFKAQKQAQAELALTCIEHNQTQVQLQVSSRQNNQYHDQYTNIDINLQIDQETDENDFNTRLAFVAPSFALNSKNYKNKNVKDILKTIPPYIILKDIELTYFENWDDLCPKYQEFDILTRRYLQYTHMTGQSIEDYVQGLKQEEIDDHFQMLQNLETLRKQTILMKQLGRNLSSQQQQDMIQQSITLDKSLDTKTMNDSGDKIDEFRGTQQEKRYKDFVEYLKEMGMKEYENGTVIFYEDETDMKNLNDSVHSQFSQISTYDSEIINRYFYSNEKQVRISRDHKENTVEHLNQSSFLNKSLIKNMEMLQLDEDLTDLAHLDEPDLEYENDEENKKVKKQITGRRRRKNEVLEYFEPIVRKKEKLRQGDGIQAKIFKTITRTKEKKIGSDLDEFDKFGRRIFYGNVKKQRSLNLQGDMHQRWVVMRGWQLYWYRKAGDPEQKGILTLPSQQIIVPEKDKKICFTLPKEDTKEGNIASRAMSFGDDFNTRIFRIFVSFMIKYKLYAEEIQRNGLFISPIVERFLKVSQDTLRTQYRQYVSLKNIDMESERIMNFIMSAIVPYKIDRDHDQTIKYISLENCNLNDDAIQYLIDILKDTSQNCVYYLNLSKNKLTLKSARAIGKYLENLIQSPDMEHLILDHNPQIGNTGLGELSQSLMQRLQLLNSNNGQSIMLPLLTLSMADTGINDQGFISFIKKLEDINNRFQFGNSQDYYRGGMAINFSKNKLSFQAFVTLLKLLNDFYGLRSINLSNQLTHLSLNQQQSKQSQNKNEQIMIHFFRGLSFNNTLTHLDISGIQFTTRAFFELLISIQSNHVLQELKINIAQNLELEKFVKKSNSDRFRLSSQYSFYLQ